MANTYLHGAYGNIGKTQAQSAIQAGTIPVYIGTAPVHLVRGYADKNLVNRPIKLTDWKQAVETLGYSEDWSTWTLCEVMKAHFDNPLGNVAPIFVINVYDPSEDKSETQTVAQTGEIPANKTVKITDASAIILDTVTLTDMADGVDYTLDYDFTTGTLTIKFLKELVDSASSNYELKNDTVKQTKPAASAIVGGVTSSGEYKGIAAIELLYNNENQVATLLAAPGWSHEPTVRNALVAACQAMNGHWMAYCFTDIPISDATTIEAATAWKQTNGFTSEYETPCWPKGIDNAGNVFHLSTLSIWRQQLVDFSHNSVPFETASNKAVPCIRQYFGEGVKNAGFDKNRANALNEKGIRTLVPSNGNMVLWGGHTGAYTYGATSDAKQIFDTNVRMLGYVINSFQREWGDRIDEPMTLQLKDEILNREQDKLDALVAMGALIGEPKVSFLASENTTTDMMNGDFKFTHIMTPTPQLKSASATISYTDAGFSVFTAEA